MSIKPIAMRDAFLDRVWRAMAEDESIFFTCADFGSPVLDKIRAQFPDRFVNVGIAEQNLINVSAGLAIEGYKVFAYAIAPFITMRCYEQIRVSLALLSVVRPLNVNLIGVGAGYSYVVSGPTHQCYEDLTIMRALPNFRLYSPSDHITAAALFDDCLGLNGPKYLRLDAQVLPALYINRAPDVRRGFEIHRVGGEVCLLATGFMVHTALQVAERMAEAGSEVGVIDIFDITGFDEASLLAALKRYRGIVTMEEGFRGRGGLDAMMFNLAVNQEGLAPILNIGVEGTYSFELGTRAELHEQVGIGVNTVFKSVSRFINRISTKIHKTGQES
jgi:transketolase